MRRMEIMRFVVGPVQTNCYFAINKESKELIVIDPGDEGARLAEKIRADGYRCAAILLTHGHFDHADGVEDLKEALGGGICVYAHEDEKETLEEARLNLSSSFEWEEKGYRADIYVKDGEELDLAGFAIRVLHTPGHTDGGCCYYFCDEDVLFSGDSLFAGSIGRTDFPKGSMSKLVRSVKEKLLTLPDETRVYPGHDEETTIRDEKAYNMFLV